VSGFTDEEIERARRYHRPGYVALVLDLVVAAVVLGALTQVSLPLLVAPPVVAAVAAAAALPVAWWRYRHDIAWGFATQTPRGWAADRAKEIAVNALLALLALGPLFWLARWYPHGWAWPAATGAALLIFLLGFLAPVVLEPVFNRFRPLEDEALSARLHELADRAGAPVREARASEHLDRRREVKRNDGVKGQHRHGGHGMNLTLGENSLTSGTVATFASAVPRIQSCLRVRPHLSKPEGRSLMLARQQLQAYFPHITALTSTRFGASGQVFDTDFPVH